MNLKSRSFTSKEPHVAREPQVADPWSSMMILWRRVEKIFALDRKYNETLVLRIIENCIFWTTENAYHPLLQSSQIYRHSYFNVLFQTFFSCDNGVEILLFMGDTWLLGLWVRLTFFAWVFYIDILFILCRINIRHNMGKSFCC